MSGASLVDVINNLVIQVLAALATGGAVVVSQYIGRQDIENARVAAKQLFYVLTGFALAVAAIALLIRTQLLPFMFGSVEPDVMKNAHIYFVFTAFSFPFIAIYNACAALFRCMGNSKISMFASLIMNIVNIGGNAILIYGFRMGAAGAGIATLVSRAVAALILLIIVRRKTRPLYLEGLLQVRLKKHMIKNILRVGIPGGFETGLFQVGRLTLQTLIAGLGTAAIAANAILNNMANVTAVPGLAMNLGIITVVGQCVGAGDYPQATAFIKKLMIWTHAGMLLLNLPAMLFPGQIIGLFGLSEAAAGVATSTLPYLGLAQLLLFTLAFTLPNSLRAAGDVRFTMAVSIISMWTARVGLAYLFVLVFHMGVEGIWYAMFCDWAVRLIFHVLRFLSGKWKTKCVIR